MNKQFEAGLLVAVAVLAMLSATTMYQISGNTNTNSVDRYVVHEWQALNHWVKNHTAKANPAQSQGAENRQAKIHVNLQPQSSVPAVPTISPANSTNPNLHQDLSSNLMGHKNEDTYLKLTQIGSEFVDSMTKSDWKTLAEALTKENTQQASEVIAGLIQTHVSNADRVWFAKQYQGSKSFDTEDVSLLQSSISQAISELTPQEVSLIEQALPTAP